MRIEHWTYGPGDPDVLLRRAIEEVRRTVTGNVRLSRAVVEGYTTLDGDEQLQVTVSVTVDARK